MKDSANAQRDLEVAATFQPEDAYLSLRRGELANLLEHEQEAIVHFQEALRKYPRMNYAYFGIGLAYLRLENTPKALAAYEKGLEVTDSPSELDDALDDLEALPKEISASAGVHSARQLLRDWIEKKTNGASRPPS